ncbi:MAG TPA: prepilin-type N-terminal cleavage/methylation domain-containing protein [Burkholderiales bacterium]|nr:prepilin-type N-terminal cleavage/methylation domain-containing protein [Burkholderiales bacterium]
MAIPTPFPGPRRPAGPGDSQHGFTLAEVAIVLFVIGLLMGLLLLGDGILTQSRIKFVANQFEGLKVAVLNYQDRYGALPGDDPRAASRWVGKSKNGTGDGQISGLYQAPPPAGDPMTALTVDAASGESLNFWWHLRLAELIIAPPTPVTPVAQPLNHYSGVIGVQWAPLGFPRLAVCAANLPGETAIGVENVLDDGDPRRGLIRAAKQSADNQPIADANATITAFTTADSDAYILCRRLD